MKKAKNLLKHPALKHSRFTKANLVIFIFIFACIGGYVILKSSAAGPNTSAANVFVSATGSDNGSNCVRFPSAQASPPAASTVCASVSKAYTLAALGDTVWVLPGTYGHTLDFDDGTTTSKSLASNDCNSTRQCVYIMPLRPVLLALLMI
jgi:hypothetical protein